MLQVQDLLAVAVELDLACPSYRIHKNKTSNITGIVVVRFFVFFQPTHILVSSLLLMYDSPTSLIEFIGSCA